MKTGLKNRTLWFDGTNQVAPELVPELLLEGVPPSKIVVTELNDDIKQFNLMSEIMMEFGKTGNSKFPKNYLIPKSYSEIRLSAYALKNLSDYWTEIDPKDRLAYSDRLKKELEEITKRDMEMLVKTMIYVIDMFKKSGTVWGVGRGSSCASLVLFLIGVHKVDPIKYRIPLSEFFHD